MKKVRRMIAGSVLGFVLAAASAGAAITPALAASVKRVVDDNGVECPNRTDSTISGAVAAVGMGPGTITVCAGVYPETVMLNGVHKVKLIAKPGAVLMPNLYPFSGALLFIGNSTDVTVQGLTIDGQHSASNSGSVNGVQIYGSSVRLLKNTITGWREPSLMGLLNGSVQSVFLSNNMGQKVRIQKNTITDFQGIGLFVYGQSKLDISGNVINATSTASLMPIGMMLSTNGVGGRVSKNTISSDAFPAYAGGSTGLFITEASNLKVSSNTISHWDWGVSIGSNCSNLADASHNTLSRNKVLETSYGVDLWSYVTGSCDAHADFDRISGNKIINTLGPGSKGIVVGSTDYSPMSAPYAFTLSATVKGNTITHFTTPLEVKTTDGGTVSGVFAPNKIFP